MVERSDGSAQNLGQVPLVSYALILSAVMRETTTPAISVATSWTGASSRVESRSVSDFLALSGFRVIADLVVWGL